jgi:shikimate kinase
MSLILIGYRGSGKTTIGKKLASRLWWKFVDTDALIVQTAGKSIKEIFEQDGEPQFRILESVAVKDACALQDHIIALGGGAVMKEENRALIKSSGHKIAYLRCKPEVLLQRIQSDTATAMNRPNLTALGGIAEIENLLAQREPLYRELQSFELDVTNLTPEEAVVHLSRMM